MVVRFDPNYPEDPYLHLAERLHSQLAVAYIMAGKLHNHAGSSVCSDSFCELQQHASLHQVNTLNTSDTVSVCGRRTVRVTPLILTKYSYPSIHTHYSRTILDNEADANS